MRVFENLNIDFLSKRKIAYFVSGTLIVLGILSLVFRGLEFGIDFKGGSEIALKFEKPIDITQMRATFNEIGLGDVEVKTFDGNDGLLVRTELQNVPQNIFTDFTTNLSNKIKSEFPNQVFNRKDATVNSVIFEFEDNSNLQSVVDYLFKNGFQSALLSPEPDNKDITVRVGIADIIEEHLRVSLADNVFTIQKEELVGPKIGEELKQDTFWAIFWALIVILVYLGFRFKFVFAVGAVAALFHDVMITLGVFSILYGYIPGLNLEISISVAAAFLTLVGYSINDTVVVFDRVRENMKLHRTVPLNENINNAINKTMRRTIVTSVTTLIVVFILLIFGGDVLRGFAFTLFFGILVGTYSSVFVASSIVYEYAKNKKVEF